MSNNNFRYQHFVAVSGNLGGKVPIFDDVLSSHEQEMHPTTTLEENCEEFKLQRDRSSYVDLRPLPFKSVVNTRLISMFKKASNNYFQQKHVTRWLLQDN